MKQTIVIPALILYVVALFVVAPAWNLERHLWLQKQMPDHPDVFVLGSSVFAQPFIQYEYPHNVEFIYLEKHPVNEARKFETLFNNRLSIWSGAQVAQTVNQTLDFLQHSLSGSKCPRAVVLFVFPALICGHDQTGDLPVLQHVYELKKLAERQRFLFLLKVYMRLLPPWTPSERWQFFQAAYRRDYATPLSASKLQTISRIVDLCEQRSIKLIVVSSPLAEENRNLIKTFSYRQYSQTIANICRGRAQFIDLGESPLFKVPDDFTDGAHCNAKGLQKIYRVLVQPLNAMCQ